MKAKGGTFTGSKLRVSDFFREETRLSRFRVQRFSILIHLSLLDLVRMAQNSELELLALTQPLLSACCYSKRRFAHQLRHFFHLRNADCRLPPLVLKAFSKSAIANLGCMNSFSRISFSSLQPPKRRWCSSLVCDLVALNWSTMLFLFNVPWNVEVLFPPFCLYLLPKSLQEWSAVLFLLLRSGENHWLHFLV